MIKSPVKTTVGIVGIVAAIVWSVRGVDFKEVTMILQRMRGWFVLAVFVLTSLNLVVRSFVWKSIVNPIQKIPVTSAISSYLIGVFSNLFLPFKLGDVAQGYALGKQQNISKIALVTAVLIQRAFEISTLVILMMITALITSVPLLMNRRTAILGVVLLGAVIILAVIISLREQIIPRLEKVFNRFFPEFKGKIHSVYERIVQGTMAVHDIRGILKILGLSFFSWLIQFVMVYLTAQSLEIDLSLLHAGITLMVINLGLMIPIAPGNIGTFQFFSIIALSWFSVSKPEALTFSIIFQVIQGIPVIFGGGASVVAGLFFNAKRANGKNTDIHTIKPMES